MTDNELRILTYNVHKGFSSGNRHFILHRLRDALVETDADVLFLQEIQGAHSKHQLRHSNWPTCSQAEFLAQENWPYVAYGKNAEYRIGHHGNAILSKSPLEHWENINVSPFTWASRSLLHGVIKLVNNQSLHIICIHLGLMGIERRRQFEILCNRIDEYIPQDMPLIVAGDFNDWTGQAEKRFSQHLQLKEAHQTLHNRYAKTWPAWLPLLRMDRVFYRGLQPLSCERPRKGIWNKLSDHAPLLATFKLMDVL